MTARLVMDQNPVLLKPDDKIAEAAEKFMQRRYRSLAVVDDEHRFLGVITVNTMLHLVLPKAATMANGVDDLSYMTDSMSDLRRRLSGSLDKPVSSFMVTNGVTIDPDTSLVETLLILYKEKVNLPVVDKSTGRLEGMISYYDIGERVFQENS